MPRHARLLAVLLVALGVGAGLAAHPTSARAAPGCRSFGQALIAGHAREADERPGVGEEAVAFVPASDDVALFKSLACG
jgi:hypothetical protein